MRLHAPPRTLDDYRLFRISEKGPHLAGFLTRALEVFSLGRDKPALSGSGLCPENSRSPRPVRVIGRVCLRPPGLALIGRIGRRQSKSFQLVRPLGRCVAQIGLADGTGQAASIAALTRSAAMNAIEIVMLT